MTWREDSQALLASGIADALEPGHLVTRFVVVAEGLQPDGEEFTAVNTNDGAGPTDTIGLLGWADAVERASVARDTQDEDD